MDTIHEILTRGIVNTIPSTEKLKKLLKSGKKLNIYLGIDPTATRIHLGNAVPLRKLQKFVELGHNVTFLIGDFTALIGDTSDKESERPVLTYKEIQENFKTYKKQASKLVDFSKINIVHNSQWLKKLTFTEIVKLCQHFSFGEFAGRELIKKRLTEGKKVALHEALYPVMQGYDSYFMDTDIQLGGADQTFNMQAGRILQKDLRGKESFVLVTGYLEGTDGRKMSKSWGNAVWLEDLPNDMFGKIMSVRDELIPTYFNLATNLEHDEVENYTNQLKKGANPMGLKIILATQIVKELHSEKEALMAKEEFENTFQKKVGPTELKEIKVPEGENVIDIVARLVGSKSQAKRLIVQRAVDIDGKVVKNASQKVTVGAIVKIGKKDFIKVVN